MTLGTLAGNPVAERKVATSLRTMLLVPASAMVWPAPVIGVEAVHSDL